MRGGLRVKKIFITNLNESYNLDIKFIKKTVSDILKFFKKPQLTELEVIFLRDCAMASLNKRYKNRNTPTDVLSFNLNSLGEIFISLDTARKNSRIFGTEFANEVILYVIHGILHLFGYTDESRKGRLKMSKKESEILQCLCEREDLSKVLTRR